MNHYDAHGMRQRSSGFDRSTYLLPGALIIASSSNPTELVICFCGVPQGSNLGQFFFYFAIVGCFYNIPLARDYVNCINPAHSQKQFNVLMLRQYQVTV